jgi:negative regulator of flagellin synthesis FlgM
MKIEGNGIKTLGGGIKTEDKVSTARGEARSNGGPASSTVLQLSTLSARMRDIESRLADTQVVNHARVEAIKQAIVEGRFKVNAEVVADKLIDTVRELISAHKA